MALEPDKLPLVIQEFATQMAAPRHRTPTCTGAEVGPRRVRVEV